jgi:predicted 2-oxoglutarate/Fe(II)-dependent dioxygenase YbiX
MQNQLADYIKVFENIVSDDLCNCILSEYGNAPEWTNTVVGAGEVHTNVRSAETIAISFNDVIEANFAARKKIDEELFACAGKAIKKYNALFPDAHIEEDSGYELLRYKEGQFYIQHTDSFKLRPRAVSCSFALNEDYEGGEWGFWNRSLVVKAPKGAAVMFPSNFMYPHEIMPVTKGVRYSMVTWFI